MPTIHRPAFFDGQRLTAADLAAAQMYHRELRWLHNRSLHNWGIAFGLAVTGRRGQRAVQVQAGLALDCLGRELILNEATELAIPAVSGASDGSGPAAYYLTASYSADAEIVAESRLGACGYSGAVRRPEQPALRWQEPGEGYRHGYDVVLAAIEVQNCQLARDVSAAERRDALPAQQPYVAAGRTLAGKTGWRLWPDEEQPAGVATTVATSSGAFRTTPHYQAHVAGERAFTWEEDGEQRQGIVDGYGQIGLATAASFELIVLLPQGLIGGGMAFNPPIVLTDAFLARLRNSGTAGALGWHVVWMGVE
jgi:hypothetical protein